MDVRMNRFVIGYNGKNNGGTHKATNDFNNNGMNSIGASRNSVSSDCFLCLSMSLFIFFWLCLSLSLFACVSVSINWLFFSSQKESNLLTMSIEHKEIYYGSFMFA